MDRLSDYDYELPEELIAQTPLVDRSASRLLALDKTSGAVRHLRFRDCVDLLRDGDLLVVNETRVTALRLYGRRIGADGEPGGQVELFLLRSTAPGAYEALARPAKRLVVGARVEIDKGLEAKVEEDLGEGRKIVSFDHPGLVASASVAPLPPYIKTPLKDRERYQTVYATASEVDGSAAAPTAGLHFTPEVFAALAEKGVGVAKVQLHVGLDTFRPVQSETLDDHVMHGERCEIGQEASELIAGAKGRIVAVGTTSARTLETFARNLGASGRRLPVGSEVSRLFLRPGSEFKVVDAMFTNFHMPRTTMLMMISALAGQEAVMNAYRQAIAERYRFLSFGDSMFIG